MNRIAPLNLILALLLLYACKPNDLEQQAPPLLKQVVLISNHAPAQKFKHYLKNDSIGKASHDSGPYSPYLNEFRYIDENLIEQKWIPKAKNWDTLVIPLESKHIEINTRNPFSRQQNSFLLQRGDTAVFRYEYQMPIAELINREANDTILNYGKYRTQELFKNTYSSHQLVMMGFVLEENIADANRITINHYTQAVEDYQQELEWIQSLPMTEEEQTYRVENLNGLMLSHQQNRLIAEYLDNQDLEQRTSYYNPYDLSKADSLFQYWAFREFLKSDLSQYDLPLIYENRSGGGRAYIDDRIRFDSILADAKYNATAKDYLLIDAFKGINANFSLKDKQEYFQKLEKQVSEPFRVKQLSDELMLDFKNSEKLLLEDKSGQKTSLAAVIKQDSSWVYLNFWATWCRPCRESKPQLEAMQQHFEGKPVRFIHLALNDSKARWKAFIEQDSSQAEHYYILNGNSAALIDELQLKEIPRYLIYSPEHTIAEPNAQRPGQGARKQLDSLLKAKG